VCVCLQRYLTSMQNEYAVLDCDLSASTKFLYIVHKRQGGIGERGSGGEVGILNIKWVFSTTFI